MVPWYLHLAMLAFWILIIVFAVWVVRRGIVDIDRPRENRRLTKREQRANVEPKQGGHMVGVFKSFQDFLRRIGRHIEFTNRHRVQQDQKFIEREVKREEMKLRESMKAEGLRVKVTKGAKGFKATIRDKNHHNHVFVGVGGTTIEAIESGLRVYEQCRSEDHLRELAGVLP